MPKKPDISFVIPIKDEKRSLKQLVEEITTSCKKIKKTYEIIFIDDGSIDGSFEAVKNLHKKNKDIRGIKLRRNFGKSIALSIGFQKSLANIVFTLDGDLQDNPVEVPKFINKLDRGFDLVSGWKKKRRDSWTVAVPSRIGNFVIGLITGVKIHDLNCGFKVYRREVLDNINIYGELYRFIPILVNQKGYRIGEVVVKHRSRKFGKSKYGWFKMTKIFLDLITVLFLTAYSTHPGHFFGTLGIVFFIPGFLIGLYITYLRITTGGIAYRYPLLFLGVLSMIVGVQFVSTGLLAEMMISSKKQLGAEEIISEKV